MSSARKITEWFPLAKKEVSVEEIEVISIEDSPSDESSYDYAACIPTSRPTNNSIHPFFAAVSSRIAKHSARDKATALDATKIPSTGATVKFDLFPPASFISKEPAAVFPCAPPVLPFEVDSSPEHADSSLPLSWPKFDLGRLHFATGSIETSPTIDMISYQEALNQIISSLTKQDKSNPSMIIDDDFDGPFGVGLRPVEPRHRPIVLLTGPSHCGKSHMAISLSKAFGGVPIQEINAAVALRTGKNFESVLEGSVHKSETLKSHLQMELIQNKTFRLILLIDEVDLVFPRDRFYPSLNNFLKVVPDDILVLMTSNSPVSLLGKFIDLPDGTLKISLDRPKSSRPMSHSSVSFEFLSDMDYAFGSRLETRCTVEYDVSDEIPTLCCPWDDHLLFENRLLAEEITSVLCPQYCKHSEPSAVFDGHLTGLTELRYELQALGYFMASCTRDSWLVEYLPTWQRLESCHRQEQNMKKRRTNRLIFARPYLYMIPCKYINDILRIKQ